MMPDDFFVEVLHLILTEINGDVLGDCCEVIEKIFKNIELDKTVTLNKALYSVKLLLYLYDKIHLSNGEINSTIPAEKIIFGIKNLIKQNFLDNSMQNELLSIISTLCNIQFPGETSDLSQLLTEFYNGILSEIVLISKQKDSDLEQLMLMLKILCTMYKSDFCRKKIKSTDLKQAANCDGEHRLFTHLVLHCNQTVAIQTSLFLVPEFTKCFRSGEVLRYIWDEFSQSNGRYFSRMFLILCNFFSIESFTVEINLVEFLIGQVNYWELIQCGLVHTDVTVRKQAMFLLKKTNEVLDKNRRSEGMIDSSDSLCLSKDCKNFNPHWDPNRKDEFIKIYSDVIIILEYLNEEQVHIVRPVFEMIQKLTEKVIKSDLINCSWILLIYELVLLHENTEVIKWGIKNLLKLPAKVFLDVAVIKKTAVLLCSNLNNIKLYYNNGLEITGALGEFFESISQLNTSEFFFKVFIKRLCQMTWSPEALFFVCRSFFGVGKVSFWGQEEVDEIRRFVSRAFRTHNKTIRSGIQCEILNATIALTHGSNLPLETVILLFSQFYSSEVFRVGSRTWTDVIVYLGSAFSAEEAEKVLSLFLKSSEYNEKCAALSVCLFHRAFEEDFACERFFRALSCFKDSHRRLYCDVSELNRYLAVTKDVVEECVECGEYPKLSSTIFHFFEDLLDYVRSRILMTSSLEDFSCVQLYLKAFESLIKLSNRRRDERNFEHLFKELLRSLESDLCCPSGISSMQKYFGMRLVKSIYESRACELELPFLTEYLLKHLNELLKKEENIKDVHAIWGKINSEFFEAKWVILENLILNKHVRITAAESEEVNCVQNENLLKMCIEGLDVGGYGALRPIMHVLTWILPEVEDAVELENVVDSVWRLIMERRKTDDFKFCIESFVKMLFHEKLLSKKQDAQQVLFKYVDLIFSDSSLVTVHTLMKHAEQLEPSDDSLIVLCQILGKGMLFGPVQKKDEKLTAQVCSQVQLLNNCRRSEILNSCQIRARAAVKLLTIRNIKGVSKSVLDTLRQMESEISKKRTRYFGNSFVHRVKTRLMQGVLMLIDSCEKEEQEKLAEWIYLSLMTENPQGSVRHLQEWSLALLYKSRSCSFNFFRDGVKKTPKGWCSVMTITYLLAKASLHDVDDAIREILPFCMDQHFEARLFAEVIIVKLYSLARQLKLREVVGKWRDAYDAIKESIERAEGNAAKNYFKLEKHFFFNGFNIRTHYSLQTIYYDLPRLTNVASDEWISPEICKKISISQIKDLTLTLVNEDELLDRFTSTEWLIGDSEEIAAVDESTKNVPENYQKKMIPMKSLLPDLGERGEGDNKSFEKEGLVVVASLIDRIPNLGGLARTCEIFGASELVVHTIKCLEDKDFKSLSVTAEKWIRVKEVKAENLAEYIIEIKRSGFVIVGAEQAVHSEPLTRTKFPRKCVLVLGNEKKGIPANLLSLLDVCVEIPQTGIIRSLNVHVTGALFLWEYAKQNFWSSADS